MNQHTNQCTISWVVLCLICLAASGVPLTAQTSSPPSGYVNCPLQNMPNGPGCIIMFTYGSTSTVSKQLIAADPTPVTHHVWLVCQSWIDPVKGPFIDVTVPVPLERAGGRQITAFSCPDDAAGLTMRCEDPVCAMTFVP